MLPIGHLALHHPGILESVPVQAEFQVQLDRSFFLYPRANDDLATRLPEQKTIGSHEQPARALLIQLQHWVVYRGCEHQPDFFLVPVFLILIQIQNVAHQDNHALPHSTTDQYYSKYLSDLPRHHATHSMHDSAWMHARARVRRPY